MFHVQNNELIIHMCLGHILCFVAAFLITTENILKSVKTNTEERCSNEEAPK